MLQMQRFDKLEDMIESLQATLQPESPSTEASSVKCVSRKQPQRPFLTSRPKAEAQGRSGPSGQNKPNAKSSLFNRLMIILIFHRDRRDRL